MNTENNAVKKRKPTPIQIANRKYQRALKRVESLQQDVYSAFKSQTHYANAKAPLPKPAATITLQSRWGWYEGYAPQTEGHRLLSRLDRAKQVLEGRQKQRDAVLAPMRAKRAETHFVRFAVDVPPPCFGMRNPLDDRTPRNADERAFWITLHRNRDDATAWLVYADWLDEQGGVAPSVPSIDDSGKQIGGYTDAELAAKIRSHIAYREQTGAN